MKPSQRSSIQKLFPKPFSLIFQTLIKTPKGLFNSSSKTSFDYSKNTREYVKIRTKILREKLLPKGYLQANPENSRWQQNCQKYPGGRPPGRPHNGHFLTVGSYRSTASVDPNKQRATCSQSVDRAVDRLKGQPACTYPCMSVDRYGRLAQPSSCRSGKNLVFIVLKNSHKISKIPQKQFSHFSLKYKLVLKSLTQI